jgi:hypothetical protein
VPAAQFTIAYQNRPIENQADAIMPTEILIALL